jgi:hypothetical protein
MTEPVTHIEMKVGHQHRRVGELLVIHSCTDPAETRKLLIGVDYYFELKRHLSSLDDLLGFTKDMTNVQCIEFRS